MWASFTTCIILLWICNLVCSSFTLKQIEKKESATHVCSRNEVHSAVGPKWVINRATYDIWMNAFVALIVTE